MDQMDIGSNRNKVDRIGPMWTDWTEVDEMNRLEPKYRMSRIGLKWIKVDRMDQIGLNRTNVDRMDRIGPMWTE